MSDWRKALKGVVNDAEQHFDELKDKLAARLGSRDPLIILPYLGYGTGKGIYLRGRVLEVTGDTGADDNDGLWDNLADMYRRFATDEVRFPQVEARFENVSQTVMGNEEGFFRVALDLLEGVPAGWHEVELELHAPQFKTPAPVLSRGRVWVAPPEARFGIISDIDDTVMVSHATDYLRMARTVFMGSARSRLPFPGVASFYRSLHAGANPLFYLSSSPWNLYDLFIDFLELQQLPPAPLFLRDWGVSEEELLPLHHKAYKLNVIRELLDGYETLPFILIGDSGQEDPEIYTQIVAEYPGRVQAVYIRDVGGEEARSDAVKRLREQVLAAGSALVLAPNTLAMAEHAAGEGWVKTAVVDEIRAELDL